MRHGTILEIEDLSVEFATRQGVVRAVNNFNLTVRQGETVGLVGESGCGKSVTASAILRIVAKPGRITSGRILLRKRDGHVVDLTELPRKGRAIRAVRGQEIGIVFLDTPTSHCRERNAKREDPVPDTAISNLAAAMERPEKSEGFREVLVVHGY